MSSTTDAPNSSFPYYQFIKTPSDMRISSHGSMSVLGRDIEGLQKYVAGLVSNTSQISTNGQPLGDAYFLNTGSKCASTTDGSLQDRYIYINNIANGNIPMLSSAADTDFTEFRGLVPGIVQQMGTFTPGNILSTLSEPAVPACQEVMLQVVVPSTTIPGTTTTTMESHFVSVADLQQMDPCLFPNVPVTEYNASKKRNTTQMQRTNPATGQQCRESFVSSSNIDNIRTHGEHVVELTLSWVYATVLFLLGVLLLLSHYKFMFDVYSMSTAASDLYLNPLAQHTATLNLMNGLFTKLVSLTRHTKIKKRQRR